MTEIDTATARRIHATADDMKHGDCHTARAVLTGMMPNMLNEIDRLRAENQRLKLAALTADRESMELDAENQRLEERHEAMADALVVEATKRGYLHDEVASVLQLMDGLAEQWGDEGVFRRCRDRLRAAVESTGGGRMTESVFAKARYDTYCYRVTLLTGKRVICESVSMSDQSGFICLHPFGGAQPGLDVPRFDDPDNSGAYVLLERPMDVNLRYVVSIEDAPS